MKTEVKSSNLVPFLSEKFKTELKYNQDSVIERKEVFINKVESVDDENGTCECIISTEEPDRMGDVVVSSGIDTSEFKKIPSIYVNHDYSALPVAVCEELIHKDKSIVAKIKFVTSIPAIKNIFELVKAGALRGVSVGFEAKEMLQKGTREFDTYVKDAMMDSESITKVRRIFKSWKLYEFSVCSVPANSNCYIKSLVDSKQEVSPELGKLLGIEKKEEPKEEVKEEVKEEKAEVLYTPEQLKEGSNIEAKEHADLVPFINTGKIIVEEFYGMIAKVHLAEDPEYYADTEEPEEKEEKEEIEEIEKPEEKEEIEKPEEKPEEPVKAIVSYWNVVRTPEEVKTYIKKSVEAKVSGKLEIDW